MKYRVVRENWLYKLSEFLELIYSGDTNTRDEGIHYAQGLLEDILLSAPKIEGPDEFQERTDPVVNKLLEEVDDVEAPKAKLFGLEDSYGTQDSKQNDKR